MATPNNSLFAIALIMNNGKVYYFQDIHSREIDLTPFEKPKRMLDLRLAWDPQSALAFRSEADARKVWNNINKMGYCDSFNSTNQYSVHIVKHPHESPLRVSGDRTHNFFGLF